MNTHKEDERAFFLGVHRAMNITMIRYKKFQKFFGNNWKRIFNASLQDFQKADIDGRGIETFFSNRDKVDPEKEWKLLQQCQARILIYGQAGYPISLQNIPSPPAVLFVRGEIKNSDFPSISVVGSRRISSYGRRVVEHIVGEIAQSGITIVSGLALGTDMLAHQEALRNNARTIGILGSGIDRITPIQHRKFAEKFLDEGRGAIVSEYLPGVEPRPEHFPVRNRLIAGISRATVVIEAAERSGSLITANLALEQGRDTFAVPGEIFSKNSAGTNQLLLEGTASPALSGLQILQHLNLGDIPFQKKIQRDIQPTGIEAEILELFGAENRMHINDLMQKSSLPASTISSNIALMEIKGMIQNIGNQIYVKNV
ncbi:DNA-processing protein DprA [Candidatus Gracilibacteria bacterium]|nr:DNA-processing protein DprA [Candidatus Gracilibacteria bacterium]